jgi:glycine cleavage system regulatory protein
VPSAALGLAMMLSTINSLAVGAFCNGALRLQPRTMRATSASPQGAPPMTTPLVLTFVGDDRPGLVNAIAEKVADCGATWLESRSVRLAGKFDVTQALTRLGVNIEEFMSGLQGEPFTGVEMFRASARLSVPEGLKLDELRKALERLAAEIMVDLSVGEGEPGV